MGDVALYGPEMHAAGMGMHTYPMTPGMVCLPLCVDYRAAGECMRGSDGEWVAGMHD